jgi:hypothetical protein
MTHLSVVVLSDCALRARLTTKAAAASPFKAPVSAVQLAVTLSYLKKHPTHRLSRALAAWTAPLGARQQSSAAE